MSDTDDTGTDDGSDEENNVLVKRARRAFMHKTKKRYSVGSDTPRSLSMRYSRPASERFDFFAMYRTPLLHEIST